MKKSFGNFIRNNSVPIMFVIICAICIPLSGFSPTYLTMRSSPGLDGMLS